MGRMPALPRPNQKITFAEMRSAGVRGILVYCSDYHCSHWTTLDADRWSDDVRLSDIEPPITSMADDRAIMSFDHERRHAAEYDQNPNRKASVPKECVDHECDSSLKE
jgi:hypothetical protein